MKNNYALQKMIENTPRILICDRASYKKSKFELVQWVDLLCFDTEAEVKEYISEQLKTWDEDRPLPDGPRKDPIIVNSENIPKFFIEENYMDFASFYHYLKIHDSYEEGAVLAFLESGLFDHEDYAELEEAFEGLYKGMHDNDENFAKYIADKIGYFNQKHEWPADCVDWSRAASDLMIDYVKIDNHYFQSN